MLALLVFQQAPLGLRLNDYDTLKSRRSAISGYSSSAKFDGYAAQAVVRAGGKTLAVTGRIE